MSITTTTAPPDPREVNFGPPADPPEVSTPAFDGPLLGTEGEGPDLSGRRSASTRGAVDHDEMVAAVRFMRKMARKPRNHAAALRGANNLTRRRARFEGLRLVRGRGRSRAARCGAGRTGGSRRTGSRAGPSDDDGESEPPRPGPGRHLHELALARLGGRTRVLSLGLPQGRSRPVPLSAQVVLPLLVGQTRSGKEGHP
jgi:hypothetical protein